MKKIKLIIFFAALLSTAFAQTTGNINLSKGQKFSVDNKITAVTTQTLMGQSMESNAEITSKYSIEVKDIKDNNYNLTNTFTKMKAKMSAMGNDLNFDSDKKEDMAGEYAASFKDIINNPKSVVINRSGKVLNINNWKDSSNKEGIQKSTMYTVKEIKGTEAVISITGILNTNIKSQMQGIDVANKSKGSLTGEEIVDITTGVIKQKTTTLESQGTISVVSQGLDIPMTTKVTFVSTAKPA